MAPLNHIFTIACLLRVCLSYIDFDHGYDATPDYIPRISVPRPWQLPADFDLRIDEHPSMITAIAPSTTMAANGAIKTMYSMHYHNLLVRSKEGRGVFRRGVFADDPPIATCTPCGFQGTISTPNATKSTSSTASCTTSTYEGVFRSVLSAAKKTTQYCYDSSYSGVFVSSSASTTGLPCCFTIPASCLSNSSVSMSYTYTSGVFRSSITMQFLSNFTTSTASPSSSSSLSTVSSTSAITGVSTLAPNQARSSSSLSVISTALPLSEIPSITVISSSTITIVVTVSPSISKLSSVMALPVTLSVITAPPSSQSAVVSSIITTVNNTVEGCGTASGRGEIIGTGTVYIAGGFGLVSSGTASGSATKVVGCGTLIATTGSFTGSATIIGCGSASGYATLDGSGTVYPAALGGMVGITSSGRVTGSGSVIGCGTIVVILMSWTSIVVWTDLLQIGTGTFTATGPYTTTLYQTLAPNQETVEVYVSYCPTNNAGLERLAGNLSFPAVVSYYPVSSNSTLNSSNTITLDDKLDNPLCHICDNDSGTCCPLSSNCGADGHCPWNALVRSGYVVGGLNVVAAKNSSGSSQRLKQ